VTRDIRALAIKYINEVIDDQRKLGYTGRVAREVREKAIADAEAALQDLAATATNSSNAVAA
jgi:hypothetical protein